MLKIAVWRYGCGVSLDGDCHVTEVWHCIGLCFTIASRHAIVILGLALPGSNIGV